MHVKESPSLRKAYSTSTIPSQEFSIHNVLNLVSLPSINNFSMRPELPCWQQHIPQNLVNCYFSRFPIIDSLKRNYPIHSLSLLTFLRHHNRAREPQARSALKRLIMQEKEPHCTVTSPANISSQRLVALSDIRERNYDAGSMWGFAYIPLTPI